MSQEIVVPPSPQRSAFARVWLWLPIGALILLTWALIQGWPTPIVTREVYQYRANVAPLVPNNQQVLAQTFTPKWDGLSGIEVTIHRKNDVEPNESGELNLQLLDENGRLVASQGWGLQGLEHNETYRWDFEPRWDSAETPHTLLVQGVNNQHVTIWGYSLDNYAAGQLTEAPPTSTAKDLRFNTFYTLSAETQLAHLTERIVENLPILLLALLFLPLPALIITPASIARRAPAAVYIALGTAIWPIIWTWVTVVGLRFHSWSLWAILIIGYVVAAFRQHQQRQQLKSQADMGGMLKQAEILNLSEQRESVSTSSASQSRIHIALLTTLILIAFGARMVAVRDLVFPAWVDSTRHALITAVMVENGQMLTDYAPYLDIDQHQYHFGFHSLAASLILMLNAELPNLLLIFGQLLNALVPLTIYGGVLLMSKRRGAALVAAFLVALPFFFPAYYVSWGRLTQLTGMLVMPILIAKTWQLLNEPQQTKHNWVIVMLLAAGMFLIHFRVFLVYLPFAAVAWLINRGRGTLQFALAAVGALILVAPRIYQLLTVVRPNSVFTPSTKGYNDFPIGYVQVGWEQQLLLIAALCLLFALVCHMQKSRLLTLAVALALLTNVALGGWLGRSFPFSTQPFLRLVVMVIATVLIYRVRRSVLLAIPLTLMLWLNFSELSPWQDWQTIVPIAVGIALLSAIATQIKSTPTARLLLTFVLWVAALFGLLLGDKIGLPETWAINLNSMYITLFLPIAAVIGLTFAALWDWVREQKRFVQIVGYVALGGVLMYATLFGWKHQATILNDGTILAHSAEIPALEWVDQNLPQDSYIAVNSWQWLDQIWAANDGGAWLIPLTKRNATTLPADYFYNRSLFDQISTYNKAAREIEDWSTETAAAFLRDQGVTHVYIGPRDGAMKPDVLLRNPATELIYSHDGVFIFAVNG